MNEDGRSLTPLPSMTVVMPVRDEEDTLAPAVDSVLEQTYPTPFEIVLAIAPSTDRTEAVAAELASRHGNVRLVANPTGSTPAGLNEAIRAASGDLVARVDAHAELSPGYLLTAAERSITTGADVVGGIQHAEGVTPFEQSVAAAMTSRFGVGDAKFHYGGGAGPVDTVYLGVFRHEALDRVGGYDERLVRNQDYELNWRIRDTGGVVWFDPDLVVSYRPRGSLRSLARQYFQYGQWKRHVLERHPRSVKARQLAAPATVLGIGAGIALAIRGRRWGLAAPAVYAGACLAAAAAGPGPRSTRARLPLVFATMHLAWGIGFLIGPDRLPRRSVT